MRALVYLTVLALFMTLTASLALTTFGVPVWMADAVKHRPPENIPDNDLALPAVEASQSTAD